DFGVMRQRPAEIAGLRGIRPKCEEGPRPAYPEPKSTLMRSFVLFLRSHPAPNRPAGTTPHKHAIETLTVGSTLASRAGETRSRELTSPRNLAVFGGGRRLPRNSAHPPHRSLANTLS